MKILLVLILGAYALYGANIAIVVAQNKQMNMESIQVEIKELFKEQKLYYKGNNSVHVIKDTSGEIKQYYKQGGAKKIIGYAKSKGFDSIALVEYKRGSKNLTFLVIVADENVQDRKSMSIAFFPSFNDILAKTILGNTLTLNYELGVINEKVTY